MPIYRILYALHNLVRFTYHSDIISIAPCLYVSKKSISNILCVCEGSVGGKWFLFSIMLAPGGFPQRL